MDLITRQFDEYLNRNYVHCPKNYRSTVSSFMYRLCKEITLTNFYLSIHSNSFYIMENP